MVQCKLQSRLAQAKETLVALYQKAVLDEGACERFVPTAHSRLSKSMSPVLDSLGLVVKTTRAPGPLAFRLSTSSWVRYCRSARCTVGRV